MGFERSKRLLPRYMLLGYYDCNNSILYMKISYYLDGRLFFTHYLYFKSINFNIYCKKKKYESTLF